MDSQDGRGDPIFRSYKSVFWDSPAVIGPVAASGDCLLAGPETMAVFWLDTSFRPRDGEIVLAKMKDSMTALMHWYLLIDGVAYLACKYFAVPLNELFELKAVVVAELRWPAGWKRVNNRAESEKQRHNVQLLRSQPPVRPDMIVFPEDLTTPELCRAAIRAHLAQQHPAQLRRAGMPPSSLSSDSSASGR